MNEFQRIAESLADIICDAEKDEGVRSDDIPGIINRIECCEDGHINCYPGGKPGQCCNLAVFVSLASKKHAKGRRHLNFHDALEKLIQHMQGSCAGKTNFALLVTDCWDASAFEKWEFNLKQIAAKSTLEIYLMTGRSVSRVKL